MYEFTLGFFFYIFFLFFYLLSTIFRCSYWRHGNNIEKLVDPKVNSKIIDP